MCLTGRTSLSQRQGECCATTSMRKIDLILEFNLLSGSSFLSRLVRQVISVPFCCLDQYNGGTAAVVLFNESNSQGLLLIYFQVPCRPCEQRLRKFKSKDFMSDEGKIENEIINYSVNRVEQICSSKKRQRTAQIDNWVMSQQ